MGIGSFQITVVMNLIQQTNSYRWHTISTMKETAYYEGNRY